MEWRDRFNRGWIHSVDQRCDKFNDRKEQRYE